jgi:pilus assembly protein CpaB
MRLVFALVFMVGIAMAGFAVYLAMSHIRQMEAQVADLTRRLGSQIEMATVIVANRNIEYNEQLKPEDVREVQFPSNAIPELAFQTLADLFGEKGTPPRSVIRTIVKDEVILGSKVTRFGQDAGVAARLSAGMRAFTVKVDVTTGVSGFLNPGDRVDVYWSGAINGQQVTKLLLEDIELIAVDQLSDVDANRPLVARTVTMQVTPLVVATLAQAQSTGRLSLSLRGVAEQQVLGPLEVTQKTLLGIEEEIVEEKRVCYTVERRGTAVDRIEVPCPDEE